MDQSKVSVEQQLRVLSSGAIEVITRSDLAAKLQRSQALDQPLRVKLGADPSAPDIHLGHAVPLRKLRQFQEFGHHVYFVIGDFTGRIGDPSGKSEARPQLTTAQVQANARTYEQQIYRILIPELTHVVFNRDWLSRLDFADVIKLASFYTVARMMERDDFAVRMREGRPVYLHEFMYPLAQAYDSVHLRADVELGGTDQTFNFVATRDIMRQYGLEPQVAITMPLLVGTDGVEKMSKSLKNYIGVSDPPDEIYGRAMSVPDRVIPDYLRLTTGWQEDEVAELLRCLAGGTNPRDVKMLLAGRLVELCYDQTVAQQAAARFTRVFGRGLLPDEMPEWCPQPGDLEDGEIWSARLLTASGLASSASEARRLLAGGAVRLDGHKLDEQSRVRPENGQVLQVGRRRFVRVCVPSPEPG